MGFIRDCFTGKDSAAGKQHSEPESPVDFDFVVMVIGIGAITLVMGAIHPALGALVLVAGFALGWLLDKHL